MLLEANAVRELQFPVAFGTELDDWRFALPLFVSCMFCIAVLQSSLSEP